MRELYQIQLRILFTWRTIMTFSCFEDAVQQLKNFKMAGNWLDLRIVRVVRKRHWLFSWRESRDVLSV